MTITAFPPVEDTGAGGLLALGGDLEIPSLLLAYSSGIFPWPIDSKTLAWFAPSERAVLWIKDFHVSRSLGKERRRTNWSFSIDRRFENVIRACAAAKNRRGQFGTWITPQMISAYIELHRCGYAHSVEAYYDGELAGGLYGVAIGKMFAGESMFYRRPNASKLALWFLTEHLQKKGAAWIDCQVMTPLLKSCGAELIDRGVFGALLKRAVCAKGSLF